MGDLRPLGSERLDGTDKIRRIMEIARYKEVEPTSINENKTLEYTIQLADGNFYGIVREKSGYIVKKGLTESALDYAEPMKNRKYFNSYSQAMRKINLIAGELNRLHENTQGINLIGEEKKFVLKTPKPEVPAEAPAAEPALELPAPTDTPELPASEPTSDTGLEDLDLGMDMDMSSPEGDEEVSMDLDTEMTPGDEEELSFKSVQKLTGKLGQKIRTLDGQQGMSSEDIKYVLNSILSALDLSKLTEEDYDDVMTNFEDAEDGIDYGVDDETELDIEAGDDLDLGMDTETQEVEMREGMYGSFGNFRRKDYKGDEYYDEEGRQAKSADIYGIAGDDFDTEEFDTFQQLYDKYGDKQSWFHKTDGKRMFDNYREMTGKPFKVKTRKTDGEMGEGMYGSFGDTRRKDFKGDKYYDEKDRPAKSGDIYGIGGDDFDTEEFDTFQQLYDKYGDKQSWFSKTDGERMFDKYREMTGKPFKVKTRKTDGEMSEEMDMDTLPSLDFEQQTIEVSPDEIKSELHSTIDQVLSKYFAPSEEEQQMFEQKEVKKFLNNKVKSSVMKNQVKQLSETIEQEMTADFILREHNNVKFLGKTNKHNLVFEADNVQLKVSTKGEIL
jgi:hypothetical protein